MSGGEPVGRHRLFLRIAGDPRHSDIEVVAFDPIDRREFAGWAMRLVRPGMAEAGGVHAVGQRYAAGPEFDPYQLSRTAILRMMTELTAVTDPEAERVA